MTLTFTRDMVMFHKHILFFQCGSVWQWGWGEQVHIVGLQKAVLISAWSMFVYPHTEQSVWCPVCISIHQQPLTPTPRNILIIHIVSRDRSQVKLACHMQGFLLMFAGVFFVFHNDHTF